MCRVDHRKPGREGELLGKIIGVVFFLTIAWFVYRVGSILDTLNTEQMGREGTPAMRADPPDLAYHQ
jgi:hypothetical protein